MSRRGKLFGQHQHKGTAGTSSLLRGVRRRVRDADPHNVIDLLERKLPKKRRALRLRKEPLDE
jgi:hypothetical protein